MKAVVLVGGEGTRLRPLTLSAPKQMLPIVGVPMIERVLSELAKHGVDEAILSLGYLPDAFAEAYPSGSASGVRLVYAVESEPLDTAGAVRFAATFAGIDETFLVVNGDVLTDLDVSALIAFHRDKQAEGTIALHPVRDPSAFGVVPTDAEGRVTAFVEKPPRDEAPTNEINAGTYVLEPSVLKRIPASGRVSIERETFPAMVRDGGLFALSDDAYWLDTGTPAAFLRANQDILEGKRSLPPSPGAHLVSGEIWASGEPVLAGQLTGACWIGEGAVIAETAVVERSVIGPGSVVEAGATVTGSILLEGSRVAQKSSVENSILGPGSTIGERCTVHGISVLGNGAMVASGSQIDAERIPG